MNRLPLCGFTLWGGLGFQVTRRDIITKDVEFILYKWGLYKALIFLEYVML